MFSKIVLIVLGIYCCISDSRACSDLELISNCSTPLGSAFSNLVVQHSIGALNTSQACSSLGRYLSEAQQCLTQFASACGQQVSSAGMAGLQSAALTTIDQLGCNSSPPVSTTPSLVACTSDVMARATACVENFTSGLSNISSSLSLNSDLREFCNSFTQVLSDSKQCLTVAAAADSSCSSFIELQQQTMDRTAATVHQTCGTAPSSGILCSTGVIDAITVCLDNFTRSFAALQVWVGNLDSVNLELYCSDATKFSNQVNECLAAITSSSNCDNYLNMQRDTIATSIGLISEACGFCSDLMLMTCLTPMANITSINDACSVVPQVTQCLTNKQLQCPKLNVRKTLGAVAFDALEMQKQLCSPECSNLESKGTQLTQCIANIPASQPISFNKICSTVQSTTQCAVDAIGSCELLKDLIKPQMPVILNTMNMYGCGINIAGHSYKPSSCSFLKMVQCYNPVLQAFGLAEFTADTALETFYSELQTLVNVDLTNLQPTCNKVQNLDLPAMMNCAIDELYKCPMEVFQRVTFGIWRTTQTGSMASNSSTMTASLHGLPSSQQFDLTSVLSSQQVDLAMKIYAWLDLVEYNLALGCTAACLDSTSNIQQRSIAFGFCTLQNAQIDVVTGTTSLTDIMRAIATKFKDNQDYSSECRQLSAVASCANAHLKGCAFTEKVVYEIIGGSANYPLVGLCKVQLGFTLQDNPGACSSSQFQRRSRDILHQTCDPAHLKPTDNLAAMTTTQVCDILQQQVDCYVQKADCCSTRKHFLEPMLHTWGMANQVMGCSLRLSHDGFPIISTGSACNYHEVLKCYNPLLAKVGLSSASIATISPVTLGKILRLRTKMAVDTNMCPSASDFAAIETCINSKISSCRYPSTCDNEVTMTTTMDSAYFLPMARMFDLVGLKSLCGQACSQVSFTNSTFVNCDVDQFSRDSGKVMWNTLVGGNNTRYCSDIQQVAQCVNPHIGQCVYRTTELRERLNLADSINSQVASQCGVTFGAQVQPQPMTTTTAPRTTTQGLTTGAEHAQAMITLITGAALMSSFFMVL